MTTEIAMNDPSNISSLSEPCCRCNARRLNESASHMTLSVALLCVFVQVFHRFELVDGRTIMTEKSES